MSFESLNSRLTTLEHEIVMLKSTLAKLAVQYVELQKEIYKKQ